MVGEGSSIVTAVALVAAMEHVQSMTQEFPQKRKKKKDFGNKQPCDIERLPH